MHGYAPPNSSLHWHCVQPFEHDRPRVRSAGSLKLGHRFFSRVFALTSVQSARGSRKHGLTTTRSDRSYVQNASELPSFFLVGGTQLYCMATSMPTPRSAPVLHVAMHLIRAIQELCPTYIRIYIPICDQYVACAVRWSILKRCVAFPIWTDLENSTCRGRFYYPHCQRKPVPVHCSLTYSSPTATPDHHCVSSMSHRCSLCQWPKAKHRHCKHSATWWAGECVYETPLITTFIPSYHETPLITKLLSSTSNQKSPLSAEPHQGDQRAPQGTPACKIQPHASPVHIAHLSWHGCKGCTTPDR